MDNTNIKDNAVNAESPNIGKKINPIPKPSTNIGIDIYQFGNSYKPLCLYIAKNNSEIISILQ